MFDAIDKMDLPTLPAAATLFLYAAKAESALRDADNDLKHRSKE